MGRWFTPRKVLSDSRDNTPGPKPVGCEEVWRKHRLGTCTGVPSAMCFRIPSKRVGRRLALMKEAGLCVGSCEVCKGRPRPLDRRTNPRSPWGMVLVEQRSNAVGPEHRLPPGTWFEGLVELMFSWVDSNEPNADFTMVRSLEVNQPARLLEMFSDDSAVATKVEIQYAIHHRLVYGE